jgi:predicted nucleic-acid-binding Zn-ribbon protein
MNDGSPTCKRCKGTDFAEQQSFSFDKYRQFICKNCGNSVYVPKNEAEIKQ